MSEKTEEFEAFRARMQAFHLPRTKELPNVGLYMDQVLGVLTDYLSPLEIGRRDDFITSSMINNYVKQGLIKPPKNKKYDKSQICYLIVICILKKVYAIGEIKTLLIVSSADKDRDELRDAYHSFCECIACAFLPAHRLAGGASAPVRHRARAVRRHEDLRAADHRAQDRDARGNGFGSAEQGDQTITQRTENPARRDFSFALLFFLFFAGECVTMKNEREI